MDSLTRDVAAGAAGGLAGGVVFTGAMLMAKEMGLEETTLPAKVERWTAYRTGAVEGRDLKGPVTMREEAGAQGGHLVVSAALGAAYGVMQARYDLPAVSTGIAFGVGLYALNLGLLGPALTVTKKPWNQRPSRHASRLLTHVAFGLVTALVARELSRRD